MELTLKETGIVRRIDGLGRIVIPREIRRRLHIHEGDALELCTSDNGVYFQKYSLAGQITNEMNCAVSSLRSVYKDMHFYALDEYGVPFVPHILPAGADKAVEEARQAHSRTISIAVNTESESNTIIVASIVHDSDICGMLMGSGADISVEKADAASRTMEAMSKYISACMDI